jgi:hypothetical protein
MNAWEAPSSSALGDGTVRFACIEDHEILETKKSWLYDLPPGPGERQVAIH